jgi:hypothetical protein
MNTLRHFTAYKTPTGWQLFNGTPDETGDRATYTTFDHSNEVHDYVERIGRACNRQTSLHYDLRGTN